MNGTTTSALIVFIVAISSTAIGVDRYLSKPSATSSTMTLLSTSDCYCNSTHGHHCYFELEAFHDRQIMHPRVVEIWTQKPAKEPFIIHCRGE